MSQKEKYEKLNMGHNVNKKELVLNEQNMLTFSRRDFLKISGAGLFVFFFAGDSFEILANLQAQTRPREYPNDVNAYLLIGEDGRIRCFSGKVELGQGIKTSLAQI